MSLSNLPKIVVTTVSNRGFRYLPNIINNFVRQKYPFKKLIIVFNCEINLESVSEQLYSNGITDYLIESFPKKSLGHCLNYSISNIPEDYSIWTKMDDDDYYGENYLLTNLESMVYSKADIVGRRDMFVYVPELKRLYFKNNGGKNKRVSWVQGATFFIKKHVFDKVLFPDKNSGEDTQFITKAKNKNFMIFAGPVNDLVVIRHTNNKKHTWKLNLADYLKTCKVIPLKNFKGVDNHIF
jgi:hypothetical protein